MIYEFGPFRLDASLGILMRGSEPVGIGHRAIALLQLLVDRANQPVAKEMLFESAWPGLAVEDSNLTVQIAAIRKAFGRSGRRRVDRDVAAPRLPVCRPAGRRPAKTTLTPRGDICAIFELPSKPSVVVLPFANLSDDPEQAYFTDGMVDDIITGLSRIKWLFVIGRGTTFAYKGRTGRPEGGRARARRALPARGQRAQSR